MQYTAHPRSSHLLVAYFSYHDDALLMRTTTCVRIQWIFPRASRDPRKIELERTHSQQQQHTPFFLTLSHLQQRLRLSSSVHIYIYVLNGLTSTAPKDYIYSRIPTARGLDENRAATRKQSNARWCTTIWWRSIIYLCIYCIYLGVCWDASWYMRGPRGAGEWKYGRRWRDDTQTLCNRKLY